MRRRKKRVTRPQFLFYTVYKSVRWWVLITKCCEFSTKDKKGSKRPNEIAECLVTYHSYVRGCAKKRARIQKRRYEVKFVATWRKVLHYYDLYLYTTVICVSVCTHVHIVCTTCTCFRKSRKTYGAARLET